MASFDENGKYIKTNWKAGDKITATKLNKIEESIEAVNDNDISRHVEADARLDALEAKDVAHDKEFTNVKNLIKDAEDAAELGDYEINSRMQFLEDDVEQAVNDMNNAVTTIRNEMSAHTNTVNTNVDNKISTFETEFDAEVAGLKAVDETIQNDVSEIQNDMNSAKTQTFTVTNAYKFTVDHDGMMPSLVTLDNIEGLSTIETNNANQKFLVHNIIHDICTIDIGAINYFDYSASTEIIGNATFDINNKSITITGDKSQGWSGVKFNLDNLTEGKRYCLFCDNVTVNSGGSGIEIVNGETNSLPSCYLSNFPEQSTRNIVFTARANTIGVSLFCTAISGNTPTQGNVTYENVQIYEVKEMIVPDIQLNSLPNGVKDEIKDGMLIKRTGYANLGDLEWNSSAYNNTYPNAGYRIYYSYIDDLKLPASYEDENKIILCNMLECKSFNYTKTLEHHPYNIPAISGHPEKSEIRIKLETNDAADLESLRTWLSTNNVSVVYELNSPEYIPVNLTIKADKGDTVVINTTKTMDLTYDIQLNTRAQIDSVQDLVSNHKHDEYLPLRGGTIIGDLSANCFESIKTVESTDGGGTIGSITKTQVFTDQYGQGRFIVENNLTNTPILCIANPHDCSISVNGRITPAGGHSCDLGSSTNRWQSLYSHPFNMFVEDNGYTSQLKANRGNFRIVDGYDISVLSWSHDYYILGPEATNYINLGSESYRFKSLYLNAQPNVSSDRTLKENIKYVNSDKSNVSYEDMYAFVKDDLELATYNLVEHDKLNMGFIAQDLLVNLDGTDNKVGQMIVNPVPVPTEEEIAEGKPYPTLSYDMGMYTSVLAGALKEAINKIEQLEARINELENK